VRGSRTRVPRFTVLGLIVCSAAAPASAELGATASTFTDDRFRGYSLSDGRPVAILDFAEDSSSGFYADGTGSIVFRPGGDPAPLGVQLTGGFAKRLTSGATIDFGITHSTYSHYSNGGRGKSYTEVYAGLARGILSSRIFLSPHYFIDGRWTAYGEINANFSPASKWGLEGHIGMLTALRTPPGQPYHNNLDWRLGVSRELGRVSLHAAWTGHGRAPQPFGSSLRRPARKNAFVVGLTAAL
jgi:uncharacterized protein (TIGR02001 family)